MDEVSILREALQKVVDKVHGKRCWYLIAEVEEPCDCLEDAQETLRDALDAVMVRECLDGPG